MHESVSGDVCVAIRDGLTVRAIGECRTQLLDAFSRGGAIHIDCTAVMECDLSGAQLIVAALKTAERDGKRVRLAPPTSGVLTRTLSRAGLTEAYEELVAACAHGEEDVAS